MNAWHHERVLGWIFTGRHVVEADYVKPLDGSSNSVLFDDNGKNININNNSNRAAQPVPDASPPSSTSSRSRSRSRSSSSDGNGNGNGDGDSDDDDDLPIPPSAAINRVFRDGRATLTAFLKRANSLPAHAFPAAASTSTSPARNQSNFMSTPTTRFLTANGEGVPPWAAFCSGHVRFAVATADGPASLPPPGESPPNSAEATELLIQLCAIYGLFEPEHQPDDRQPELLPATSAFLAALALPFFHSDGLQPQFPSPLLKRWSPGTAKAATKEPARIRQYTADLRYYMTLSMNTKCLGSALWSIFWQPDIETNLIARYLETLKKRCGFGSMSLPETTIPAWTGTPQPFLDDEWQKSKGLVQDVQLGFRKDTGRSVPDVPDHLGTLRGRGRISANEVIRLGPSRDSTLRMLNFYMQDVRDGRDACLLGVSATASHPWLKYCAG
ncbi:hypothetical protein B0T26DRAFT_670776 [Lasiosphaeria miniovina]|uniref:Uncharacterized protein n=1 Tax=Lasiosphaeria miniovina TaxID=1954250 RepID=A0AA40BHV7_9PEZI|nr:uncharacterized protein B0T26DRAFT_670776 [Lasiosphaeria miniovina]KAK0734485.1 hypothetical protein B0T26DRAFT_670776 [Lasiosphaeria miniovina]